MRGTKLLGFKHEKSTQTNNKTLSSLKKPANAGFFVYLIIQSSDRKIIIVIYIGKGKIRSRFLKYILISDAVSIHQS